MNDRVSLYLSDILKRNNLDPKRTKLVRHSLKDECSKACYEKDFIEVY